LKAKKANEENDWEKSIPTLILAYNATQHYSTNSSPARIFLRRELNIPHYLRRASDDDRIRRQFRAYEKPQADVCVGEKVYYTTLPPQGNSRKLLLTWSGPVLVTKIIYIAMTEVKE